MCSRPAMVERLGTGMSAQPACKPTSHKLVVFGSNVCIYIYIYIYIYREREIFIILLIYIIVHIRIYIYIYIYVYVYIYIYTYIHIYIYIHMSTHIHMTCPCWLLVCWARARGLRGHLSGIGQPSDKPTECNIT